MNTIDDMQIDELRERLKGYDEKVPCLPGDMVYRVSSSQRKVIPMKVHSVLTYGDRVKIVCIDENDRNWKYIRREIDVYVFRKKEDAERRLAEIE